MISIMQTGELLNANMTPMGASSAVVVGLSTDSKPTGVGNGWMFIEMDSGKIYFYDAAGAQWREF